MLKARFLATLISLSLLVSTLVIFAPAARADATCGPGMTWDPGRLTCVIQDVDPGGGGTGGEGGTGGGDGPGTGTGPTGPRVCEWLGEKIPCSRDDEIWVDSNSCYASDAGPDYKPAPDGHTQGSWYMCRGVGPTNAGSSFNWWSDTPPPGFPPRISAAEAARRLAAEFDLVGVSIGIVPKPAAGSKGSVGLPVWMWVDAPSANSYGPYSLAKSYEGLSVSGTASVTSIDWDMGDGAVINCPNAGSPYDVSFGVAASPNCGYSYSKMSNQFPGGKYTVTATSHWQIRWQAGAQTGVIDRTTQSSTQVEIGEMQTVIVK